MKKRTQRRRKTQEPPRYVDKDAFAIIGKIPRNTDYQWVAIRVLGEQRLTRIDLERMKQAGWRAVPARRHPQMPREGKHIVIGGNMLMECSRKHKAASFEAELKLARDLMAHVPIKGENDQFAVYGRNYHHNVLGGPLPVESAKEDAGYEHRLNVLKHDAGLGEGNEWGSIDVSIQLRLSRSQVETAAHLHLSAAEYASRLIKMMAWDRGNVFGHNKNKVLMQADDGIFDFGEIRVHKD